MTFAPEPSAFDATRSKNSPSSIQVLRPNVTQHYWGYVVTPNEHVFDVAFVMRGLAGLATTASFLGALLVWFLPDASFSGDTFMTKAMASILMACIGGWLLCFVARGTLVRVHIDKSSREVSQVVRGLFGTEIVLSRFGLDMVESVDIVASTTNPSFGQIQIRIRGVGRFPAGDGALTALVDLKHRLAVDCGLATHFTPRDIVWADPLHA